MVRSEEILAMKINIDHALLLTSIATVKNSIILVIYLSKLLQLFFFYVTVIIIKYII